MGIYIYRPVEELMGCNNTSFAVTDPQKDAKESQAPPKVEKTLEDEVSREWADELSDLFVLWDIDKSGFLETAEIGRVVAKYNDEDWDNWDAAQRDAYLRKFMEWFDSEGTADRRLDKTEFIRYVVTEAIVRNPEDPDGSVGSFANVVSCIYRLGGCAGAIVKKFTDIIQDSRISDLFVLWDKDKSGQLDSIELNTVISKFNDQDSEVCNQTKSCIC